MAEVLTIADVHQGRGLGLALASAAAAETLSQGKVPYWGATNSNIRSHRTALGAGLVPSYVEVLIRPTQKAG